ncbi:MAG: hypothetical protein A3J63_00715 [Candidatus Moranbacteria bacterium RIFCSPHIGHO2_02_FULL_40_12b]|nr:MAG: hypothetical protein A3J63_00715 [Candidatus Moranbacteria bacterium RIFCSPHIGHO2_02_FULL_40_12b]
MILARSPNLLKKKGSPRLRLSASDGQASEGEAEGGCGGNSATPERLDFRIRSPDFRSKKVRASFSNCDQFRYFKIICLSL